MSEELWAIVEIMGHRRHAGRVTEVHRFGVAMLRVEVPRDDDGFDEHVYAGGAIFGLRRVTEEEARAEAKRMRNPFTLRELEDILQVPKLESGDTDDEESLGDAQW